MCHYYVLISVSAVPASPMPLLRVDLRAVSHKLELEDERDGTNELPTGRLSHEGVMHARSLHLATTVQE